MQVLGQGDFYIFLVRDSINYADGGIYGSLFISKIDRYHKQLEEMVNFQTLVAS